jgi:hypothetical protein
MLNEKKIGYPEYVPSSAGAGTGVGVKFVVEEKKAG